MKIRVLGAFGSEGLGQRPSAFLVNERVLLDAGTVTGALGIREQVDIEHVVVSHAHLDHIAGLAFLTETLACCGDGPRPPVTVASLAPIVDALRTGVFNNVVWPDFSQIPSPDAAIIRYRTLREGVAERVGDLSITPVTVNHTVPTAGFIVHDGEAGFVYSGDTGPTDELWKAARARSGMRAVILECAFPNRLDDLAGIAKHMTPDLIRRELDKLPADIPVWIYHVKPQFYEETAEELSRIGGDRVSIVEQDKVYTV
jgi:ribonuclease BN (tRNA processing enzyme)